MRTNYPFLRDPRALLEIRKHQWIESEKIGGHIGFGTAAIDWMNKYGQLWKEAHVKPARDLDIFLENRKYRRFSLHGKVTLIQGDQVLLAETLNISYLGLLCRGKICFKPGSKIIIQWGFEQDGESGLVFNGMVSNISSHPDSAGNYKILLKFDEESKKKIEDFPRFNS